MEKSVNQKILSKCCRGYPVNFQLLFNMLLGIFELGFKKNIRNCPMVRPVAFLNALHNAG